MLVTKPRSKLLGRYGDQLRDIYWEFLFWVCIHAYVCMCTHALTKQANFKPVGEKNVLLRKSSGLEDNFKLRRAPWWVGCKVTRINPHRMQLAVSITLLVLAVLLQKNLHLKHHLTHSTLKSSQKRLLPQTRSCTWKNLAQALSHNWCWDVILFYKHLYRFCVKTTRFPGRKNSSPAKDLSIHQTWAEVPCRHRRSKEEQEAMK